MIRLVKKHPWILPMVIFALIIIRGATLHELWGDEAETAFYARTILMRGLPYAFDGTNITSLAGGAALNEQLINHVNPWLPFYLTALSFRLFGQSSFAARLPFLLFSIAAIPALYFLTRATIKNNHVALLSTSIAVCCVPFILFSYNARYYSLTIFFGLVFMWSALRLTQKSWWPNVVFVCSLVGFLYSQYVSAALLYVALFIGLIAYITYSKLPLKQGIAVITRYIFLGGVAVAVFIPWFWGYKSFVSPRGAIISEAISAFTWTPTWFRIAIRFYNVYNIFPYVFLLILIVLLLRAVYKKQDVSGVVCIATTVLAYILLITGLSASILTGNTFFTEVRYNLILFPLFFIVNAWMFYELWSWNRWIGACTIMVYVTTNLFTGMPIRSIPVEYAHEWIAPYTASNETVASYLNANAQSGDTAFVNSDRAHEPLMFLLRKKILFVNRVSPDNPALFPANYSVLPKYTYAFVESPDWVILYSNHSINASVYDFDLRSTYPEGLFPSVDVKRDYTLTVLPIFYGSDETRPELEEHVFKRIEPSYDQQVFIYHKKPLVQ